MLVKATKIKKINKVNEKVVKENETILADEAIVE